MYISIIKSQNKKVSAGFSSFEQALSMINKEADETINLREAVILDENENIIVSLRTVK